MHEKTKLFKVPCTVDLGSFNGYVLVQGTDARDAIARAQSNEGDLFRRQELTDVLEPFDAEIDRVFVDDDLDESYAEEVPAEFELIERIRQSIRDENVSYGEIVELRRLYEIGQIADGDIELLQWADAEENPCLPK